MNLPLKHNFIDKRLVHLDLRSPQMNIFVAQIISGE
jgi:hypothetical protein